jgi:hypothetical protein
MDDALGCAVEEAKFPREKSGKGLVVPGPIASRREACFAWPVFGTVSANLRSIFEAHQS